jgi:glycosyltransferase involved in cell wall biosynthesis
VYFRNKNILIISPEHWNHLFVSKHHYAIELANLGNRVFFLNPPALNFSCTPTRYMNIFEVNQMNFVKGLRFLPSFIQRAIFRRRFKKLEKLAKTHFDCVWSFDNSVFFDFSFLPKEVLTISHIMDYSQDFQLATAARTAKLCLGVSQNIVDLLKKHNKNSFVLGHGLALDRTEATVVNLPGTNQTKAVFAGNLDRKHFDKAVLLQLAEEHPEVDFIFYGSGGSNWKRLPNTYYPGVVDSALLPNYLRKADVLLLAYKVDEYPLELTNSHKILEYLASGNIIVSSYLADYADKSRLLKMVTTNADFSSTFSEVISNLAEYNREENNAMRKSFAEKNSYVQRLVEIESLLKLTD